MRCYECTVAGYLYCHRCFNSVHESEGYTGHTMYDEVPYYTEAIAKRDQRRAKEMQAQMREEREKERREAAEREKLQRMVTKVQARWRAKIDMRNNREFLDARTALRDEYKADIKVRCGHAAGRAGRVWWA